MQTFVICEPKDFLNKKPMHMGHIACMRNQFKSIDTFEKRYDYIITFRRGNKIYNLRILCVNASTC